MCGCSSKIGSATPIQSSKLKWAWQAQFLSHTHETLQNFFFLKDLQKILVPFFEIFDRFWSTKKLASLHLHVNQDLLELGNICWAYSNSKNVSLLLSGLIWFPINCSPTMALETQVFVHLSWVEDLSMTCEEFEVNLKLV